MNIDVSEVGTSAIPACVARQEQALLLIGAKLVPVRR